MDTKEANNDIQSIIYSILCAKVLIYSMDVVVMAWVSILKYRQLDIYHTTMKT